MKFVTLAIAWFLSVFYFLSIPSALGQASGCEDCSQIVELNRVRGKCLVDRKGEYLGLFNENPHMSQVVNLDACLKKTGRTRRGVEGSLPIGSNSRLARGEYILLRSDIVCLINKATELGRKLDPKTLVNMQRECR